MVIIDTAHLADLMTATDPNNHEDRWALMDILKQFYIKEIQTDADGNFSTYLRPGSYELLGKFTGDDIIRPISINDVLFTEGQKNYTFQVVADQTTTISKIEFPPPTVQGYIKNAAGDAPIKKAWVEVVSTNGMFFNTLTDDNGFFSLTIKELGDYQIKVVRTDWDYEGTGKLFVLQNVGAFTISEADVAAMEAKTYVVKTLKNSAEDTDGVINMPAPNMTVSFEIDGNPISSGEWSSVEIEVLGQTDEFRNWIHVPTRTADVQLYLPDGNYGIRRFNSGPLWVDVATADFANYNFTIPADPATFKLELGNQFNTKINVKDEDGVALEGYRVELEDTENFMWFNGTTNANGDAYFNISTTGHTDGTESVPNNNVKLHGYVYKDKWYELGTWENRPMFEVKTTHSGTSKMVYNISITKPNFRGRVFDRIISESDFTNTGLSDPGTMLTDGHMGIRKMAKEGEMEEWFGTHIDMDGNFEIALTSEGQYMIEGANGQGPNSWFEVRKRFDVKLIEGKYVVVKPMADPEETPVPWTMPVNIGRTPPNFSGYLYKSATITDGTPVTESIVLYEISTDEQQHNQMINMQLRETGIDKELLDFNPWMYEIWVQVNADGSFAQSLDATKTYEVVGVGTPRRYYEFATGIAITLGPDVVNYVVPPKPNFNGVVKDFGGVAISNLRHGRVELEIQQEDFNEWLGTDIDDSGAFGMALEAGKTYTIREVWYETEEGTGENKVWSHHRITLNRRITVGTNSSDLVLAPNLKVAIQGAVSEAPDENQNHFGASIIPVYTEAYFTSKYPSDAAKAAEDFNRYKQNPWEFSTWIEGKYNEDTNIYFYTYLDDAASNGDGKYRFEEVNGHNLNLRIEEAFTLAGADSVTAVYNDTSKDYTLTFGYTPNVKGIITEDSVGVDKAWVNIQRTDGDHNDWTIQRWFGTRTNAAGEFSIKLKEDGDYKIDGYHTEGRWEGTTWVNGEWSPVGYSFKVVGGALRDANGNPLANDTITLVPNVSGKVYKIFKENDSQNLENFIYTTTPVAGDFVQIKKAWISIWPYDKSDPNYEIPWDQWEKSIWTETDEQGNFKLMLDDGDYIITEVGMHNFWMRPELVFTVSGGVLVENGHTEAGKLVVKPDVPNFSGVAYTDAAKTKPLKWGWFMVQPATAKEHDWESTMWINTDREGNFEFKLADGDFKIVEMGGHDFWQRINIPLNVTSGVVTSAVTGLITDGTVTLFPPSPNVKGIVRDKSGNAFFGKAWITIKPANAGEHEWDKAEWTEYRLQDDGEYYFAINLPEGSYKIVDIGSHNFFYNSNVLFSVDSSMNLVTDASNLNESGLLVLAPPTPNITGTVYGDTDNDTETADVAVPNAWIGFARFSGGKQVTMDGQAIQAGEGGYDEWANIYWHHTRWTETNDSGEFAISLQSGGTYRVVGVSGPGLFFKPNTEVTIVGNETYNLDIKKPGPNVTFTVQNIPSGMLPGESEAVGAWLDIYMAVNGEKHFMPVEFKSKTVTGEEPNQVGTYTFEAALLNGDYKIAFFGTGIAGAELEQDFTVNGTTAVTVELGAEEGKVIVKGSLKNGDAAYAEKMWVKFSATINGNTVEKKTQTNASGEFTFKLDSGVWTLIGLSGKDGAFDLSASSITIDTADSSTWNVNIESLITPQP